TTLSEGKVCFRYLLSASFLFPLGTALSAFYLGQGQTKKVILTSLMGHALHILLDFPLVFGIPGYLVPLGALGSVISAIIAQLFFCLLLLKDFLGIKNRIAYATNRFSLKWVSFWKYTSISIPRSVAKMIQFGSWIAITRIMMSKGGDYAAVVAFGGSLQLFFLCLNEGMSQALTTIGAYLIGSKQPLIWKAIRSGCLFLALESLVLAIPLIFFPESMVSLFFKQHPSYTLSAGLSFSCIWIWLSFLAEGLNLLGFALLSAYGDTIFQMWFAISSWVIGFIPIYFLIERGDSSPDTFWLILAIGKFIAAGIYFLRLLQEKWKTTSILVSSRLPILKTLEE
ncbi:MAG TPA: MATE family efflux transporter, partial [Candidatus Babeliaceae bacterium]|nr:MATE family efflux transporter [Candidatus Babeliaceae bacterium]